MSGDALRPRVLASVQDLRGPVYVMEFVDRCWRDVPHGDKSFQCEVPSTHPTGLCDEHLAELRKDAA